MTENWGKSDDLDALNSRLLASPSRDVYSDHNALLLGDLATVVMWELPRRKVSFAFCGALRVVVVSTASRCTMQLHDASFQSNLLICSKDKKSQRDDDIEIKIYPGKSTMNSADLFGQIGNEVASTAAV